MEGESPAPASRPPGAVFLSYASQDVAAAERIASTLRAAGIEVWIDKSELRGGDAWDQSIRKQIKACALFIPIISRHAHDRIEGYFRLEWKLAVDRSHLIAPDQAFLLPVAIDDTPQSDERIPDRFRELQWTRLPAGEATPGFIERVRRLLSREASSTQAAAAPIFPTSAGPVSGGSVALPWRSKPGLWAIGAVVAVALTAIAVDRLLLSRRSPSSTVLTTQPAAAAPATAAAFNPPPHSVAVLPFVNMSGDKEQEYFSEGLTEELLNSLSRIDQLQVAARTSSFSFASEHPDITTVAHKLNVGAVLEGSVRRSEHTIRVTAQLVNAVTGFHVWSQTYDRSLGDVLQLQTEIATAVASALKVSLLGDEAAKIEVGATRNPAAFDAYLRATKTYWGAVNQKDTQTAIGGYSDAIRLDPDYPLGYAARSMAITTITQLYANSPTAVQDGLDKALADARRAIALAPNLAEAHLALAEVYEERLEFEPANEEYERALTLGPGNARVLRDYGLFAVYMGRGEPGLASLRRAVALDPLNDNSHVFLGVGLAALRRYNEAVAVLKNALGSGGGDPGYHGDLGVAYYRLGDLQAARSSCEGVDDTNYDIRLCLALTYDKLGRRADADKMLAKIRADGGDTGAVAYSEVYAQRGDTARALDWLDTAMRERNTDLRYVKTEALLDPLRKEPRFQAIERALKFPN
jgi:TolB-like protein/Tfp pilus assembly protein PilF